MTTLNKTMVKAMCNLQSIGGAKRRGDFAADKGIVIAITVAIAGLALFLSFGVLKDTIGPSLTNAIEGFFKFK